MKNLLGVLASVAIVLLMLWGIIFGLDDKTTVVPSPAITAQDFLRSLATDRYDMAVAYLDQELERQTEPEDLKQRWQPLAERAGRIINVNGEWERIQGDSAIAGASLKTSNGGSRPITLALHREQGVWKIAELGGIDTAVILNAQRN